MDRFCHAEGKRLKIGAERHKPRYPQMVCGFYRNRGKCSQGARCPFVHEKPTNVHRGEDLIMLGVEEMHIVECYPTNVITNGAVLDISIELNLPTYDMTGIQFQRSIYRPIGQPDILLSQIRDDKDMYQYARSVPPNAMEDTHNLRQEIAAFPPPANIRNIPDHFNDLGWTWEKNVAPILSEYVDETFFNGEPFIVKGYEAFGTISLLREANRWRAEDWRENPPVASNVQVCAVCLEEDIDETPVDNLLALRCGHVFHRKCILTWVWRHHAAPKCPSCHQLI